MSSAAESCPYTPYAQPDTVFDSSSRPPYSAASHGHPPSYNDLMSDIIEEDETEVADFDISSSSFTHTAVTSSNSTTTMFEPQGTTRRVSMTRKVFELILSLRAKCSRPRQVKNNGTKVGLDLLES